MNLHLLSEGFGIIKLKENVKTNEKLWGASLEINLIWGP